MKKILIIEDDKIVANIYGNKFKAEGFQVEFAADGLAGLEMVSKTEPDLVMLDLMLPKLSGVEIIKGIRAQEQFKTLPIVVFSNSYLSNLVQEAWKAGANKCLSKAESTPRTLLEVIKGIFNGPVQAPPALTGATPPPMNTVPGAASPSPMRAPRAPVYASTAAPAPPPHPAPMAPPPMPRMPARTETFDPDAAFQGELRKNFLDTAVFSFGEIKSLLHSFTKSEDDVTRLARLFELYRRISSISSNAGVVGLRSVSNLAGSLEALMKELHDKPQHINPSTLRTLVQAVDFLGAMLEKGRQQDLDSTVPSHVLVVDDDVISRRAVTYALEKADLKNTSVEDPSIALKLLSVNSFDLVILDVEMPGMNGFDLCSKLRTLPMHAKTPVIFVTSLADFTTRARTTLSGGNDLIAKPFLFIELSVKAITYVLRSRVNVDHALGF
jgi:DNA-binding response OmpR family regulator